MIITILSILKIKCGSSMKELGQEIIKFNYDKNFRYDDFYISKNNKHIIDLLNKWPKWEKIFKH